MANDQIYQLPAEVLVTPDDAKARTYQTPAEVLITPTDAKAQLYTAVVEVLYPVSLPSTGDTRVQVMIIG